MADLCDSAHWNLPCYLADRHRPENKSGSFEEDTCMVILIMVVIKVSYELMHHHSWIYESQSQWCHVCHVPLSNDVKVLDLEFEASFLKYLYPPRRHHLPAHKHNITTSTPAIWPSLCLLLVYLGATWSSGRLAWLKAQRLGSAFMIFRCKFPSFPLLLVCSERRNWWVQRLWRGSMLVPRKSEWLLGWLNDRRV